METDQHTMVSLLRLKQQNLALLLLPKLLLSSALIVNPYIPAVGLIMLQPVTYSRTKNKAMAVVLLWLLCHLFCLF